MTGSIAERIEAAVRKRQSGAAPGREAALPCLKRNNCNESSPDLRRLRTLTSQHEKTAAALTWNVQAMADKHGIERLGFLTLTFADHVIDAKEAQRRFKSFRTGVLSKRYRGFVRVVERHKSGRIHYHLVVVLDHDIRSRVDMAAFSRRDYRSAGSALRSEWAFLRLKASRYGFGRTELLPIKSTAQGIARYVGKYIAKHIGNRMISDKGVRLVEYSRSARSASARFSWTTLGARSWRRNLASFAIFMFRNGRIPSPTPAGLRLGLGSKWAYHWREVIISFDQRE